MQILSATSAFPKHYYSQEMLFAALQQYWGERLAKPGTLGVLAAMGPGFCSELVALEW